MHRPLLSPALVAVPLAVALLTGCSGGGATSAESAGGAGLPMAAGGTRDTAADSTAVPGGAPLGSGAQPLARAAVDSTAVVRTAEVGVRVEDLRATADRAARMVRDAGGTVAAERTDTTDGGGYASAELVLRVPPERFDDLVGALAALGEERFRTLGTEEVGEQLVDLETRLAAQRASVERVRALLASAQDLAQVVQVEAELTRRTADLESLEARLAGLRDRVSLSTVTLRLDTDGAPEATALPGFLDGLRGGWRALVAAGTVLGATTGAVLPFLPFLVVAGALALRAARRRGGRTVPLPAAPPAPTATA